MRNILGFALALGLAALAGGCKESKPQTQVKVDTPEDVAAAELERFQAEENARSRVTMIDAATGDAAAMPADSSGPTAYDLAEASGGTEEQGSREPATAAADTANPAPAVPSQPAGAEEFPSVAQPNGG